MDVAAGAALAAAQGRAKAAQEACRRATRQLAAAAGAFRVCGRCRVRTGGDVERARELILLALANHDEIDVVVLTPCQGPHGAKEENDAQQV